MQGETRYFTGFYLPTVNLGQQWFAAYMTLKHFLKFVRSHNQKSAELNWTYPHGSLKELRRYGKIDRVIRELVDTCSISHHAAMASLASIDPIQRELHFQEVLDCLFMAKQLGIETNVVHLVDAEYWPYWLRSKLPKPVYNADLNWRLGIESALRLKRIIRIAKENNLDGFGKGKFKIGFETASAKMPAFHDPREFCELFDGDTGVVLDMCHLDGSKVPFWKTYQTWQEYVLQIHVCANQEGVDDHGPLTEQTIGRLIALENADYEGRLIAEVKPAYVEQSYELLVDAGFA